MIDFLFKKLPYFFLNIWRFRKEMYQYRGFDYSFNLMVFRRSLELLEKSIKNGLETEESKNKKINKINRVIELMKKHEECSFIEDAEREMGREIELFDLDHYLEKDGNKKVFNLKKNGNNNFEIYDLANKMENDSWLEIWNIIRGSDDEIDGSDMRTWWD